MMASINRGTIQGTVTDQQGGVIPGVTVTITNTDTGVSQTTKTNSAGFYYVPELVPGPYKVRFEITGFVTTEVTNLSVRANEVTAAARALELGRTVQQVEVKAASALVQVAASNSSFDVEARYIQDLPVLGRDIQSLVQLVPGAVQSNGPPGTIVGFNSEFGGFPDPTHSLGSVVAVNGSQGGANVWYLDGNINAAQGTDNVVVNPSPDAVAEFQAVNNNFAAEYGRNAGAVFNVVLKSGTNALHGDLYEYNRNSYFHARNPFSELNPNGNPLINPFVNWNQFGGTLGGPVYLPHLYNGKNRTFFFVSWDISLLHEKIPSVYTVPTLKERDNDFSEIPSVSEFGLYDPMTTKFDPSTGFYVRQPFLNPDGTLATSLPTNRLDPVAMWYMKQYPNPNYLDPLQQNAATGGCLNLCNNFLGTTGSSQTTHNLSFKVDHQINDKHKFFAEWLFNPTYYANYELPWTGATAPQAFAGANGPNPYRVINQVGAIGLTSAGTTVVNEARLLYSRQVVLPEQNPNSLVNNSGVQQELQGLDIPSNNYSPVPNIYVNGLSTIGGPAWTNSLQMTESVNLLDNLTKVLSRHTLKTGFMYRLDRTANEDFDPINLFVGENSCLTCNGITGQGGSGIAQFMLGAIDQGSYTGYYYSPFSSNRTYSFYIQDDFRVTKKLTLNLGLRYDIYGWYDERHNELSYFDFNAPNPIVPSLPGRIVYVGTPEHPARVLFPANKGDFAPRINFAYSPFADRKTVIRGGMDLIYTNGMTQEIGQQNGAVNSPGIDYTTPWNQDATGQGLIGFYETPSFILSQGAPAVPPLVNQKSIDAQDVGAGISGNVRNPHDPSVAVWNLQIQRELPGNFMASVGYVGSKGTHLISDMYRNLDWVHTADVQKYRLALNAPVATPSDLVSILGPTIPMRWTLLHYPEYPYGVTNTMSNDGSSSYEGLQVKVEKRFSHGLNFIVAYAAQKTIASQDLGAYTANTVYPSLYGSQRGRVAQVAGGTGGGGNSAGGARAQDPDNLRGDRALAPDDIPQILNLALTYELPLGHAGWLGGQSKGLRRRLLEGWRLSSNFNVQRGIPMQITGPCNDITCRPNLVGDPATGRSSNKGQREQQWFNPSAFEPVFGMDPNLIYAITNGVYPDGSPWDPNTVDAMWRFGTAGLRLGNARSPGFWNVDMALLKDFKISETKSFELRWENYNALNHQNLGLPNTGWCLPPNPDGSVDVVHQFGCQFGRIYNVQTDPRNLQFGLKFVF
jgi:hypothetical protein